MPTTRKYIYVIDDEEIITQPIERLLTRALIKRKLNNDYQVIPSNNPVEALSELQKLKGDSSILALVVADMMMPQMNGLDFLAKVKADFPFAPRIMLTGYADKESAVTALNKLELFFYAEKPWDNNALVELCMRGLNKHRQDRIEDMFSLYVPLEVIEDYINKNNEAFLLGREVLATVMFMDIVDFTSRTEHINALEVVKLLNRFFSEMVTILHQHRGILDKYTGDGLMALFGVPNPTNNRGEDASNAIKAALDIEKRIRTLNEEDEFFKDNQIRVRIGIHSGKMVVGNIGSSKRVNYTAVSDTVNTASRIEDAARNIIGDECTCILISQETNDLTQEQLGNIVFCEKQNPVKLRGKSEAQTLYKVIATGL
jgi:adenylate cyclase